MENQGIVDNSSEIDFRSSFKFVGFWKRFLAVIIDSGILFGITIVFQSMFNSGSIISFFEANSLEQFEKISKSSNSNLSGLISLIVGLFYYIIFWVNYDGATPGKRLLAIKIIKEDGTKVSYATAIIRYLGNLVSGFVFGLGYLWVVLDKKKQSWHDKIANTYVIQTLEKPKTILAIFLSVLIIFFWCLYFGAVAYKGIVLTQNKLKEVEKTSYSGVSYKQSLQSMKPKTKDHYDRSQLLFEQMRQNANNPEKVTALNDKNIQELKKAIEIEPNNPLLWIALSNAFTWVSSEGSLNDGLEAAKKAEQLDPDNVLYINHVGDFLIRIERYEDAILQLNKTLRITDKSGYANLSLGIAYKKLKITESAKNHFRRAIDIFTQENSNGSYDQEILQAQKELAEIQ